MVESKNLKLKLGLCGLALTSFLALNSRANTVHADTVNGGNASAITWDSDQDDSQVVKEDSQQQMPAQSEHVQAPAVQSVPVQNKVEQPAQKQATVQSNVQNRQSQPNVAVANVSSTQAMPNRAEKSIVRQSNVETSTVNRLNADSAYNNQANVSVKVANLDATIPTRITNPQNNQVIVHYVKTNGQSAGLADQMIDVTKSGTFNYNVPAGYQLSNPKYTNTETTHDVTYTGILTESEYQNPDTISADKLKHVTFLTNLGSTVGFPGISVDNPFLFSDGRLDNGSNYLTGQQLLDAGFSLDDLKNSMIYYYASAHHPEDIAAAGDTDYSPSGEFENGKYYGRWPGHIMDQRLYPVNEFYDNNSFIMSDNLTKIDKILTNLKKYEWNEYGLDDPDHPTDHNRPYTKDFSDYYVITYSPMSDAKYNYVEPVHDAYVFQDNSGQVKSVAGNHVNIAVTKPQNVDPNSSDCRRQAQRVIHVAFPNGVKPKSYDSITDSAGNKLTLDSNNNLTQTVTFTRTKTVDGLTGTTLSQTSWKQTGAINAVTLPAIPGYTMVTNTK